MDLGFGSKLLSHCVDTRAIQVERIVCTLNRVCNKVPQVMMHSDMHKTFAVVRRALAELQKLL